MTQLSRLLLPLLFLSVLSPLCYSNLTEKSYILGYAGILNPGNETLQNKSPWGASIIGIEANLPVNEHFDIKVETKNISYDDWTGYESTVDESVDQKFSSLSFEYNKDLLDLLFLYSGAGYFKAETEFWPGSSREDLDEDGFLANIGLEQRFLGFWSVYGELIYHSEYFDEDDVSLEIGLHTNLLTAFTLGAHYTQGLLTEDSSFQLSAGLSF